MVWKLVHLYTPERNSKKNKLVFFNDELFYSIWFGKTIGLIISFSGLVSKHVNNEFSSGLVTWYQCIFQWFGNVVPMYFPVVW